MYSLDLPRALKDVLQYTRPCAPWIPIHLYLPTGHGTVNLCNCSNCCEPLITGIHAQTLKFVHSPQQNISIVEIIFTQIAKTLHYWRKPLFGLHCNQQITTNRFFLRFFPWIFFETFPLFCLIFLFQLLCLWYCCNCCCCSCINPMGHWVCYLLDWRKILFVWFAQTLHKHRWYRWIQQFCNLFLLFQPT